MSQGFKGELWTVSDEARQRFDVRWIFGLDHAGLSPKVDYIHTGHNSGYQAISLAVLFGAKRILLLGYDFQRRGGKAHWHPDHPSPLGNGGNYRAWIAAMNVLAKDLEHAGVEVINCSPGSALNCFPKMSVDEVSA